jgi:hypothetical protein
MNSLMNKRAVGIFNDYPAVEQSLRELRDNGYAMEQVSVMGQDSDRLDRSTQGSHGAMQNIEDDNHADDGAKTGAVAGGALGGLTGLLVGLGTLAIPGVGPIMLAGAVATAVATTVAGGAIGAAAGGLIGALVGLGIPEDRARFYSDEVSQGKYLVMVDGTDVEISQAETILKRQGIHEWEVYPLPNQGTAGRVDPLPSTRLETPSSVHPTTRRF